MDEHYRLFVAIPLPQRVRQAAEAVQSQLRQALPGAAIRWTPAEQFHLTLRFLGDVPANLLDHLVTAMEPVAGGQKALALSLENIGFFPHPHQPRVIWIGIGGDVAALAALSQNIAAVLAPFAGPAEEGESFVPHLTLGRVKMLHPLERRGLVAAAGRSPPPAACWTADRLRLMRSVLNPAGACHQCLKEWSFAGQIT